MKKNLIALFAFTTIVLSNSSNAVKRSTDTRPTSSEEEVAEKSTRTLTAQDQARLEIAQAFSNGATANQLLIRAAEKCNLPMARVLVEELEADLEFKRAHGKNSGLTALFIVVRNADADKVERAAFIAYLIDQGADVDTIETTNPNNILSQTTMNQSPLHSAAALGDLAIVRLLVQAGACVNGLAGKDLKSVDAKLYPLTPLDLAASECYHSESAAIFKYLLDRDALMLMGIDFLIGCTVKHPNEALLKIIETSDKI